MTYLTKLGANINFNNARILITGIKWRLMKLNVLNDLQITTINPHKHLEQLKEGTRNPKAQLFPRPMTNNAIDALKVCIIGDILNARDYLNNIDRRELKEYDNLKIKENLDYLKKKKDLLANYKILCSKDIMVFALNSLQKIKNNTDFVDHFKKFEEFEITAQQHGTIILNWAIGEGLSKVIENNKGTAFNVIENIKNYTAEQQNEFIEMSFENMYDKGVEIQKFLEKNIKELKLLNNIEMYMNKLYSLIPYTFAAYTIFDLVIEACKNNNIKKSDTEKEQYCACEYDACFNEFILTYGTLHAILMEKIYFGSVEYFKSGECLKDIEFHYIGLPHFPIYYYNALKEIFNPKNKFVSEIIGDDLGKDRANFIKLIKTVFKEILINNFCEEPYFQIELYEHLNNLSVGDFEMENDLCYDKNKSGIGICKNCSFYKKKECTQANNTNKQYIKECRWFITYCAN